MFKVREVQRQTREATRGARQVEERREESKQRLRELMEEIREKDRVSRQMRDMDSRMTSDVDDAMVKMQQRLGGYCFGTGTG
jgi:uncharacterized protein YacL